jgi:TetR/AcrR family transcriptional regulator, tetracycline repressor protein
MTRPRQVATGQADESGLWFNPPAGPEQRRRVLTRDRLVAEALAILGQDGVDALSMRALATRLGVVPGSLYRHVRGKEQLHDLVLDSVLAEVDRRVEDQATWTDQIALLAHRLRTVLEKHPGTAGLLKARDPLGPHSLALAEAFLASLSTAGLSPRRAGLAYSLVYGYTLGFALDGPASANEQRIRDSTTRAELHAFFRSLPPERFPAMVALGEHVWIDNRDERFTTGLDTILTGLAASMPSPEDDGGEYE